jgi:hypothetical protein
MTERQRQARQAAALAQAAASVATSDSIDAVLDAICECGLAGTRALAAWVKLDDGDHVAPWVGAAGVPDGFRELLRSAAAAATTCSAFERAVAARGVVVYADLRQQMERELGMECPLNLQWQPAAIAPLLYRGAAVGLLTCSSRSRWTARPKTDHERDRPKSTSPPKSRTELRTRSRSSQVGSEMREKRRVIYSWAILPLHLLKLASAMAYGVTNMLEVSLNSRRHTSNCEFAPLA